MPSRLVTAALVAVAAAVVVAVVGSGFWPVSASMQRVREQNAALDLRGRNAVVVGGTSGIGEGIALRLARAHASVTVVGRSAQRGAEVVERMQEAAGNASPAAFQFVACDCFSLAAVAQCSRRILDGLERQGAAGDAAGGAALDYLVLSQGMATLQGFTPTVDGLDQKLTLHVWSRAAFMMHLLAGLRRAEDARVLSVLSAGVHGVYANWRDDPELAGGSYSIKNAADAAGLYNDILVDSMARDCRAAGTAADGNRGDGRSITFMHAAPGFVATRWGTEMPAVVRWLVRGLQFFGRSQADCAEYLVAGLTAQLADAARGSFRLLDQYGQPTAKPTPVHEEAREAVFAQIRAVVEAGGSVQQQQPRAGGSGDAAL